MRACVPAVITGRCVPAECVSDRAIYYLHHVMHTSVVGNRQQATDLYIITTKTNRKELLMRRKVIEKHLTNYVCVSREVNSCKYDGNNARNS